MGQAAVATSSIIDGALVAEEDYDPAWPELEAAIGGRKHLEGSQDEKRIQFNGMADALQRLWPPVEGIGVEDTSIPAPDSSNSTEVLLRIYKPSVAFPSSHAARSSSSDPLPIVVWYHGGGWVCGTLDSEDAQCRGIAALTPCVVVSVGYGLLPENMTPGMLSDCLAAFNWARTNAASVGGDPERMVEQGGSAGGALAFNVVYMLGQRGREKEVRTYWRLEMTAPVVVRGPDHFGVLELLAERSPDDPLLAVKFSYDEVALKRFPRTYIVTAQKGSDA